MSLELVVLGSSGSGPDPQGPASGYLVRSPSTALWLDAGTGTFMALTEWMDPGAVDAIIVSHVHADHCADVLGYVHYAAYRLGVTTPTPFFAPPGAVDRLAAFLEAGPAHPFFDVLEPTEVSDGDVLTIGDVRLTFALTAHSVPTVGVRFDSGGRSLAYSADTGLGGGYPRLARGADVALSEAGLGGPRETAEYPYHLSGAEAGAIADEAGAGRLILTHLAPTLAEGEVVAAAEAAFTGPVIVARPGLRITV